MALNQNLALLSLSLVLVLNLQSIALSQDLKPGGQDVKAAYWFLASEFPVNNIDASLFTHLFCAFADINPQTNQLTISTANTNAFSTFTATVQPKNANIKTLISVGGGSAIAANYAKMASQSASRKAFIDSSIKLARQYKFHGLDLDYEYPTTQADMTNLGLLFSEWRAAIVAESKASNQPQLHPSPPKTKVTSGHAVLNDPASAISATAGIKAWISAGVSPKKLVLGLPYYGFAWKLANPQNHGVGAAATGPALPRDGSITYIAIKDFIAKNKAVVVHDAGRGFDYTYSGTTWIGFDDAQTISDKVSFAKKTGLRGYFAWHVGNDDNWVLSKAARRAWEGK